MKTLCAIELVGFWRKCLFANAGPTRFLQRDADTHADVEG